MSPQNAAVFVSIVLLAFLDTEQMCVVLGISRMTLWRYIVKGWLHQKPTFHDETPPTSSMGVKQLRSKGDTPTRCLR